MGNVFVRRDILKFVCNSKEAAEKFKRGLEDTDRLNGVLPGFYSVERVHVYE